jgi:uncharacterized BrkB/YihY/UPF0761 family membrane protein
VAPLGIVAGFGAGAYIAWVARLAVARERHPLKSRYFLVAAMFGAGVLTPVLLVLYALFPDWSLMYLANPAHLPLLLVVPMLLLHGLAGAPLGFLVVHRLLRLHDPRPLRMLFWGVLGAALVILVFGAGRLTTVAYYDAFHAGGPGLSLLRSALFLPLMLTVGAAVSVYVFTVMHTRRHVEMVQGLSTGL